MSTLREKADKQIKIIQTLLENKIVSLEEVLGLDFGTDLETVFSYIEKNPEILSDLISRKITITEVLNMHLHEKHKQSKPSQESSQSTQVNNYGPFTRFLNRMIAQSRFSEEDLKSKTYRWQSLLLSKLVPQAAINSAQGFYTPSDAVSSSVLDHISEANFKKAVAEADKEYQDTFSKDSAKESTLGKQFDYLSRESIVLANLIKNGIISEHSLIRTFVLHPYGQHLTFLSIINNNVILDFRSNLLEGLKKTPNAEADILSGKISLVEIAYNHKESILDPKFKANTFYSDFLKELDKKNILSKKDYNDAGLDWQASFFKEVHTNPEIKQRILNGELKPQHVVYRDLLVQNFNMFIRENHLVREKDISDKVSRHWKPQLFLILKGNPELIDDIKNGKKSVVDILMKENNEFNVPSDFFHKAISSIMPYNTAEASKMTLNLDLLEQVKLYRILASNPALIEYIKSHVLTLDDVMLEEVREQNSLVQNMKDTLQTGLDIAVPVLQAAVAAKAITTIYNSGTSGTSSKEENKNNEQKPPFIKSKL